MKQPNDIEVINTKKGRVFLLPKKLASDSAYMKANDLAVYNGSSPASQIKESKESAFADLPPEVMTDMGMTPAEQPRRSRKKQS